MHSFPASLALSACTLAGLLLVGNARGGAVAAAEAGGEPEAEAEPGPESSAPDGKARPGFERGALQKVSKGVGRLLGLAWEKQGLRLDREAHEQHGKSKEELVKELTAEWVKRGLPEEQAAKMAEARAREDASGVEVLFHQIREASGAGGYGSSSSGAAKSIHFDGGTLSGRMEVRPGAFRVVLAENSGPERQLDFREDGAGGLSLVAYGAGSDLFLRVSQKPDGAFRVTHLRGKELFQGEAPAFAEFYLRNRRYAEEELLPLLRHLGLTPPPLPQDPRVKAEVLSRLRPLSAAETRDFEQTLRGLDDNEFAAREAASKKLAAAYGRLRPLIEKTLKEGQPSPETRQRLQSIVEKSSREFKQVEAAVAALGLLDDAGYLVSLLDGAKGEDLAAACARLRKLTGQELPAEAAAWKKWWAEASKAK